MPDRCSVTNCNSNYKSTNVYVSVFQFPKDLQLKSEWIRKIPRKDFTPSNRSVVCEKHFNENCIIRYDELPINGEICRIKRSTPKLKPGFEVLSVISDNNSVNRNTMFALLANGSLTNAPIRNPASGTNLYLLFDAVHLLKSIRNNWLNQADKEKSFTCPSFEDEEETKKKTIRPRFGLLRTAYRLEESSPVKFAFHLNVKSLYPTSMERQNVLPAVNVFHESNPAALERLAEHHPNILFSVDDTATFLRLIKKWWDTMNVSHPNKGKFTRNPDSKPLSTSNPESLIFLSAFVDWVKKWRDMKQKAKHGCLTKQTFFALIQTTSTIKNIANALLKDGVSYVLTAKFHTDALEFRFSQYRQLSGCNCHVSLQQVLESERKLRVRSVLYLHSSKHGDIPMKLFVNELCQGKSHDVDIELFKNIVELMDMNVSSSDTEILTYIAGYCVHKLQITCDTCKLFFQGAFDISVDLHEDILLTPLEKVSHTAYLDLINRGGMKTPSSNVVFALSVCYVVFQKLICELYENLFISYHIKQHTLLVKLSELYLKQSCIFNFEKICSQCNVPVSNNILKIIHTFANVCLNNYAKNKTDKSTFDVQKSDEDSNDKKANKSKVVKCNKIDKNIVCAKRKVKKFKK